MKPIFKAEDFCQHSWDEHYLAQYANKILKERLTPRYGNSDDTKVWSTFEYDTHIIYCTEPEMIEVPTITLTKEKIIKAYFKIKQLTILASEDDYLEALCKELGL